MSNSPVLFTLVFSRQVYITLGLFMVSDKRL